MLLKGTASCELLLLASLIQSIKRIYRNCAPWSSVAISNPVSHTGFGIQLYRMRLSFTGCSVPVSTVLPLACYIAPTPPKVGMSVLPGGTSAVAVSLKALVGRVAQCGSLLCQTTGLGTI